MENKKGKEVRCVLNGEYLEQYESLKQEIGTFTDPETLRVIITQLYRRFKQEGKIP